MQRNQLRKLWAFALALTLAASRLIMIAPGALADEIWYTRSGTRLRSQAATSASAIITIKGGEEVSVVSRSGGWSKVRYGSHSGYIRSDLLVQITRSGYIPLQKGNECPQVKDVQTALRDLGYFSGSCNGKFGDDTEAAVRAFQKRNAISADGVAGGETQRVLYSGAARAAESVSTSSFVNVSSASGASGSTIVAASGSTLKKGMSGTAVKAMQTLLKNLGYITFAPDGVFGSGTEKAVMEFQSRNGLSADGKVGAATLSALSSSRAVAAKAPASSGAYAKLTLKKGDAGSEVTKMQQRLRELGYINFAADGKFGTGTRNGVVAFQKANSLSADGIAGPGTLTMLYSSSARTAPAGTVSGSSSASSSSGSGPSSGSVKLLHFFDVVKVKYPSGTIVTVYDPASKQSWKLKFMSMGRHADSEPLSASDTAVMNKAFGNTTTWTPKAVWVKFPDGVWSMATMHNTPHLSSTIRDNNFNGHLCVHFLRDMDEVSKNDPNYGVQNQKALRAAWKALSGQTVD
ncbi:MAG: peptidoglycan-binding protein [Oscillospiraceae bacterium]|nr:peptidoglycan-binding protein [Oscillospiraceae bacterium]